MKKINFFVYDYPSKGNDSDFIEDELILLSKIFEEVNIIPLKKSNFKSDYINYKNINYDFTLNKEIFNFYNILKKLKNILLSEIFWKEIFSVKKSIIKKISMIIKERYLAECIYIWVKKKIKKADRNELFYSYWANHTLLAFYLLKKQKIIKNCFARTLGSDLFGFIPNDKFVPFKSYKFQLLDFLLILNEGQKKLLLQEKLMTSDRIIKAYQGMNLQNFCTLNNSEKDIHIVSCGALIHVKNTIKILEFIYWLKKILPDYDISYTSIGDGYKFNEVKTYVKNNLNSVNVNIIRKIPNFFEYLKSNKVDYFINLSHSEGMSFAIMEALSCSIPVICSNIPGNIEIINNKNGHIIHSIDIGNYTKVIKKIEIEKKTNLILQKKIESRKIILEKLERKKALNNLKAIISKFYRF